MPKRTIEIKDAIYSASRSEWRGWLEAHHRNKTEAWLLIYKKGTTTPSVKYSEAVEEALCYGWIDSSMKGIDKEKYAQRFTPRRGGSNWTASNVVIAERMIQEGKMQTRGLEAYRTRKNNYAEEQLGVNHEERKRCYRSRGPV